MVRRQGRTSHARARRMAMGVATAAAAVSVGASAIPPATAAPAAQAASAAQAAASNLGSAKYLASLRWYQELVDSVTAQVVALYPKAYLLEIDGVSPTGLVGSVFGVTSWRFDFNAVNADDREIVIQATVDLPSTTASIHVMEGSWSGLPHRPRADESRSRRRAAPTGRVHRAVPVRHLPPAEPENFDPHPLYIFDQGEHGFIGVDTVTGEVGPL